jgi:pilus assembly protein CpaB
MGRALVIALVTTLLGVGLVVMYMHRFEEEASGGDPVRVLTAVKPIEPDSQITEDMLAPRVIPRAYVEDRAILESERGKVIGLRTGRQIQAQQTVMWTDLSIAMAERRNLSQLVQSGMRAVTVPVGVNDDSSLTLIRPGDRVDIMATLPPADGNREQRSAVVLLQNVLVLAVGPDTGGADESGLYRGPAGDALVLSLSLTVPETQLISLAVERSRLTFALRNPDDVRVTEGIADMNSSALQDRDSRNNAIRNRKAGSGAAPKEITGP